MVLAFFKDALVVVRGGGDLASGAIYRLHRAGFPVVVSELSAPLFVRRTVSYGEAVYSGTVTIEGITARLVTNTSQVTSVTAAGEIAVMVDPEGAAISALRPLVIVDARMEKTNLGTRIDDAPLVIALGPGFSAGVDCHAVIETNRGHRLGRVIEQGGAEPDTGEPGSVKDKTHSRVLRAQTRGHVHPLVAIGDTLETGAAIAKIGETMLYAPFTGVLRGLIHERVEVWPGLKIGDLDPRAERENCFTISDKSLAVGGGVLEAVMASSAVRARLYEAQRSV